MKPTPEMIEAAAEALWILASKERFGKWPPEKLCADLWRKDAKAALAAAFKLL